MKRKRAKMPRFVKLIVFGAVIIGAMSFIHLQIQISDREARLNELVSQTEQQKEVNDAIRNQIENGVSDEYIASIAREHGYVMPNERVFKNASSK